MSRTPVSPMTKERKTIRRKIERTYDKLRNSTLKSAEGRGLVQQSCSDGILYVGIRFTDKNGVLAPLRVRRAHRWG